MTEKGINKKVEEDVLKSSQQITEKNKILNMIHGIM